MSTEQAKNAFSLQVETAANKDNILLISSLAKICDEYGIEPMKAVSYVNRGLKEKLQLEAEDLKMIKCENAERTTLFIE